MKLSNIQLSSKITHISLITFLAFLVIFYRIGDGQLALWDEAVHASISLRIVEFGSEFIKTDGFKYYKPPTLFLATSFLYELFGFSEFTSRVIPAIFGILCIIFTYLLASKIFSKNEGLVASLILLTTSQFIHKSRMFMLDVPTAFFFILAVFFYVSFENNQRKRWFFISLSVILGFLIRYWIALLIIPVILIPHALFSKTGRKFWKILIGLTLLCIIIYIFFELFFPNEFYTAIQKHVFKRLSGDSSEIKHVYGNFYFIQVILLGMNPYSLFLPISLINFLIYFRKTKNTNIIVVLFWACLIPFVFSLSESKLPWYIIPAYPAFAIITAKFLFDVKEYLTRKINFTHPNLLPSVLAFGIILLAINPPVTLTCFPESDDINDFMMQFPKENRILHKSYVKKDFLETYVYFNDFGEVLDTENISIQINNRTLYILTDRLGVQKLPIFNMPYFLLENGDLYLLTNDKYAVKMKRTPNRVGEICYPYFPKEMNESIESSNNPILQEIFYGLYEQD